MSVGGPAEQPGAAPPLPISIWVVAWSSLAGQVALLPRQGMRSDNELSLALSLVLGPLVVGFVSMGVIRARTVRLAIAWIVLVLSSIAELVGFVSADDARDAVLLGLSFATSAVALAGLAWFSRSEWFAWQRTRPPRHEGASIRPLVAIALVVGVLGGLVGPAEDGVDVTVQVAGR